MATNGHGHVLSYLTEGVPYLQYSQFSYTVKTFCKVTVPLIGS